MTLGPDRLTRTRWMFRSLPQMFDDDQESGGGGDEGQSSGDDKRQKFEWTEDQQREIQRIAAKEAKAAAKKAREDYEAELAKKRTQDEEAAKRKKAEEAGEFEQVKQSLTQERDSALSERDTLKAEHEALAAYVTADIAAVTKAVKDAKESSAAKALLRFYPGDDAAPLTLLAWAKEAKDVLPELTTKQTPRGNGPDPRPGPKKAEIPSPLPKSQYM